MWPSSSSNMFRKCAKLFKCSLRCSLRKLIMNVLYVAYKGLSATDSKTDAATDRSTGKNEQSPSLRILSTTNVATDLS